MTDKESLIETAEKFNLSPLTQEPVLHIDSTPDKEYTLRILRTYRANCNCRWTTGTWDDEKNEYAEKKDTIYAIMNQHQRERAELLDEAIKVLEAYYNRKKT
ncbi:hypothetical protein LCGC14_0224470 [marine sediment metagenome]|uniref:Uncharacterized protein n=1 Tax=marine sediment metagenome TaxID=412755 RepID=A0A0F9XG52_9ZZZZ|nr:hypothetical protein [bacterium]